MLVAKYANTTMSRKTCGVSSAQPELFSKQNGVYVDQGDRFLPKLGIDNFDVNSMKYQTFVRRFTILIAKESLSDEVRLLFFMQCCEPDVRDTIIVFTGNDPTDGYRLAWQTLHGN